MIGSDLEFLFLGTGGRSACAARHPFLFFNGQSVPESMPTKFPHVRTLLKAMGFRDFDWGRCRAGGVAFEMTR